MNHSSQTPQALLSEVAQHLNFPEAVTAFNSISNDDAANLTRQFSDCAQREDFSSLISIVQNLPIGTNARSVIVGFLASTKVKVIKRDNSAILKRLNEEISKKRVENEEATIKAEQEISRAEKITEMKMKEIEMKKVFLQKEHEINIEKAKLKIQGQMLELEQLPNPEIQATMCIEAERRMFSNPQTRDLIVNSSAILKQKAVNFGMLRIEGDGSFTWLQ